MANANRSNAGARAFRRPWMTTGFTLIELVTTTTLLLLIVLATVPSFASIVERGRLRTVVERLRADIALTHTEALLRHRTVVLSFHRSDDGEDWCYGLSLADHCDCRIPSGPGACELDEGVSTRVTSADSPGVQSSALPFALTGGRLIVPGSRPTLTAGSARFASRHGRAEVRVASTGRVRLCSPAGDQRLISLDPC
jgi:Tfp pilus assembly protein FimT